MFYFLSLLEVLPIALSKSGVSPPSKNGNSLQGMKGPVVFCFLLLGGFGGAGLFLIVSGSCFLGVTPLKILLSNFCCTEVTRSSSSSFKIFSNSSGSAPRERQLGVAFFYVQIYRWIDLLMACFLPLF